MDKPARMWTGNFNSAQLNALVPVYPEVLNDESATMFKTTMVKLLNVLETDAALMWFAKS